jgi:hypothetical protein
MQPIAGSEVVHGIGLAVDDGNAGGGADPHASAIVAEHALTLSLFNPWAMPMVRKRHGSPAG